MEKGTRFRAHGHTDDEQKTSWSLVSDKNGSYVYDPDHEFQVQLPTPKLIEPEMNTKYNVPLLSACYWLKNGKDARWQPVLLVSTNIWRVGYSDVLLLSELKPDAQWSGPMKEPIIPQ